MAKVVLLKPYLETDATWEMIRTSTYLGLWYMASKLIEEGHEVFYLDETVRNNGMEKTLLYSTVLSDDGYSEFPINMSIEEYRKIKNLDFNEYSPYEFVGKYGAFREKGKIQRVVAKTGNSLEDTVSKISEISPDYVAISLIATANLRAATKTGKMIKEKFPNIKVIYGGHHISALYDKFVLDNPWVDYVVVGDGIDVISKIVSGSITEKVVNEGFKGFENFPLLNMDVITDIGYPLDQEYSYPSFGRKSVDFMFSKGCFRKCEFCFAGGQKGNRVTCFELDRVDKQFEMFKNVGIKELIIQDDAFIFGGIDVLKARLQLMKNHGFYWQDSGGIDFELLTDDVTDAFIEYNSTGQGRLTGLYVPFNPRYWNKNDSATKTMIGKHSRNFENLKRLRNEGGIYVFTSEILGTPECTREIIESDVSVHKEMIAQGYLDTALTLSATLLPGTLWYANHHDCIVSLDDVLGFSLFTTHHNTDNLTASEIEELVAYRTKELNTIQNTYNWQTAFPNSVWDYKK